MAAPVSVIEFAAFRRSANELLSADEQEALINLIAYTPMVGDLIPDSGGLRKLRIGRNGIGKRGGARVIYYFHNTTIPVLLLALYAKNERVNLSANETREMRSLVEKVVTRWVKK